MADAPTRKRRWRRRLIVLAILIVGVWWLRGWIFGPRIRPGSFVQVDLSGDFPETSPSGLLERFLVENPMSLLDLIESVRGARQDDRIAGVVVRVRDLSVGWAKAQDIRDALLDLRNSGKRVVAYMEEEFTSGVLGYYVASAAHEIYVPPGASMPLSGLVAQYLFLGGLWEKLDISVQVEKIREYKTAGDLIVNKEMSPHHREMANALLDSIYGQVVDGIASGRQIEPETVRKIIDRCPITSSELLEHKLVDAEKFFDELRTELVGSDDHFIPADTYRRAVAAAAPAAPQKIAVVYAVGAIVTGEGGRTLQEGTVGSDTIIEALQDAADDDAIKAIVLRLDSPGGSALASDVMWHAARTASVKKPVVASMSDVAASGGYYVAAGATRIVAQPGTLTGSIGVVTWKPNITGLLERFGINSDTLTRGKFANLLSLTSSFNAGERERVVTAMRHIYDLFVARVAQGRSLSPERVNDVGRGRVWTGEQALAKGLVDQLGGFFTAVSVAKGAAGLSETDAVDLVFYPQPRSVVGRVINLFDSRFTTVVPRLLWRRLQGLIAYYEFPDGSLLTLMPQLIEIR